MPASTLLLHVMKLSPPSTPPVRVLGVDDWSRKKERRYGAILVNLERHKIIDLLPGRSSETFAKWLRKHPEVEIISRDRGTVFAAAARTAAPQAKQIADRFHIVHNLAEALESLLARCRTEIAQSMKIFTHCYFYERNTRMNRIPHERALCYAFIPRKVDANVSFYNEILLVAIS